MLAWVIILGVHFTVCLCRWFAYSQSTQAELYGVVQKASHKYFCCGHLREEYCVQRIGKRRPELKISWGIWTRGMGHQKETSCYSCLWDFCFAKLFVCLSNWPLKQYSVLCLKLLSYMCGADAGSQRFAQGLSESLKLNWDCIQASYTCVLHAALLFSVYNCGVGAHSHKPTDEHRVHTDWILQCVGGRVPLRLVYTLKLLPSVMGGLLIGAACHEHTAPCQGHSIGRWPIGEWTGFEVYSFGKPWRGREEGGPG